MSQPSSERLDSWKEIATYLGRDLRTVRRWEEDKGLPVHRVPGGERRVVFAYRSEIDAWLKGSNHNGSGNNGSANNHREGSTQVPPLPVSQYPGTAVGRDHPTDALSRALITWLRQNNLWTGLLLACVLATCVYGLWRRERSGPVEQMGFNGTMLLAKDARGSILWTYDFGQPLYPSPDDTQQRISIVDLGPDRQRDVLVEVPFRSRQGGSSSDALYCFSARGKFRWRHVFNDEMRFGGHDYGPPWTVPTSPSALMVTTDGDTASIWSAAEEVFWSPSTLIQFDRDGHRLAQFTNWGHITVLKRVHNASGSYILAGGISNQCDCAMLAVLREDHASGSSPAREPAYACENCPEGMPYRYLLFPRSELTELSGTAYNNLKLIQVDNGYVWVGVSETSSLAVPGADWEKYDLSENFVPQSFTVSDHYWTLHRQMEAEGKIHHTIAQCPERRLPKKVSLWSSEHGWQEILVPASKER